MKYDLHTHTRYSSGCGAIEPEHLVKTAISRGLDGIAVTDHNTIKGAIAAKKFETGDFKVIIGCEITTTDGELIGLFLQDEIKSKTSAEVIEEIHDQDGIVVVPHPFDRFRSSRFNNIDGFIKQVDAIEVFNSRCISNKSNDLARDFVTECGGKYNIAMTGGSDAHYLNEVGLGYTKIGDAGNGIQEDVTDCRYALQNALTNGMGHRSSLINHARTKLQKLCR